MLQSEERGNHGGYKTVKQLEFNFKWSCKWPMANFQSLQNLFICSGIATLQQPLRNRINWTKYTEYYNFNISFEKITGYCVYGRYIA